MKGMPEEIEVRHGTLVLVKKHSYGWDFYPVISTFEGMIRGYVVMDNRGNQSIVEDDEVYDYYLCDDIEEDRFYYLNDVIIRKMGERK